MSSARLVCCLAALAGALLLASGCGSSASTSTSLTGPSDLRCQPAVSVSTGSFDSRGGTGTVSIAVSRECSWSASSEAAWIAITSDAQGQGDGTIGFRVQENGDPVARQSALLIAERRVAVAQQAAPCRFGVTVDPLDPVPHDGGLFSAQVRTHPACGWTAAGQVPWVAVSPASGRGDGAVRIAVEPNAGAERTVHAVVAGVALSATQRARGAGPSPAPNTPTPSPGSPAPPPSNPPPNTPPGPAPPQPAPVTPVTEVKLDGLAGAVEGSCPELRFILQRERVYTTAETRFKRTSCQSFRAGMEVEVEGMRMSDGTVRADAVERDD